MNLAYHKRNSETAGVGVDAVWKAMVNEEGECMAAAARILSGLGRHLSRFQVLEFVAKQKTRK